MSLLLDLLSEYEKSMDEDDNTEWIQTQVMRKLAKDKFECLKEAYETRIVKPGWWGADVKRKELEIEYDCSSRCARINVVLVHYPETNTHDERFSFSSYDRETLEDDEKFKKDVLCYVKAFAREAKNNGCRKVKGK